jgi:hypothetical protein
MWNDAAAIYVDGNINEDMIAKPFQSQFSWAGKIEGEGVWKQSAQGQILVV